MSEIVNLELPAGDSKRQIAFEVRGHSCAITIPPPRDTKIPSVFLIGLPKGGSTLLTLLTRPLMQNAGLRFVGLSMMLRELGIPPGDIPSEVNLTFQPKGYAFGGFRSLPGALSLPQYAAGRTIVLVRDPRDMLTSLYFSVTRSHKPPGDGVGGVLIKSFERNRQNADDAGIDTYVLDRASSVLMQYDSIDRKLAGLSPRIYRYEDVIFDKLAWVESMLSFLDLDVDPTVTRRTVRKHDVIPAIEDATLHVRKVAPGDHAEKLRPQTVAQLNAQFAPILSRYGYA